MVVQGELIVGKGLLETENLPELLSQKRDVGAPLRVGVHDLLELNYDTMTNVFLSDRKAALQASLKFLPPSEGHPVDSAPVFLVPSLDERISLQSLRTSFSDYTTKGYEGMIIKGMQERYGPETTWYKIKNYRSVDILVTGIRKTENFIKNGVPESFSIGAYSDGEIIPLGFLSAGGLDNSEKEVIMEVLPALRLDETDEVVALKPTIVLEIEYMAFSGKAFSQARIRQIRPDKHPRTCRIEKIGVI
jgi:ATP-dependent DNA ligase